jgi:hypothetical protein
MTDQSKTRRDNRQSERLIAETPRRCDPGCRQDEAAAVAPPEPGKEHTMKTIGILTVLAALLATASIASAQSQSRSSSITYGDRYSTSSSSQSRWDYRGGFGSSYGGTYTGDRSGGMSFGGM